MHGHVEEDEQDGYFDAASADSTGYRKRDKSEHEHEAGEVQESVVRRERRWKATMHIILSSQGRRQ